MVGTVAVLGTLNFLIDPYGLFRIVSHPALNAVKPHPDHSLADIKMAAVRNLPVNALIVGNSRAEIGFDPEHPAWRGQSLNPFNLAVPGSGIEESSEQLVQLDAELKPDMVLIGLEFLDFLIDPRSPQAKPSGAARPSSAGLSRLRLKTASLFSIQASMDSLRTVRLQRDKYPESMTPRGFNPLRDYEASAKTEGYYSMFRQRAVSNAQRLARMPKNLFVAGSNTSSEWIALTQMLEASARRGGKVAIVIYPYHAQLLAMFEQYGLWDAFEAWKKRVAEVAEATQRKSSGTIEAWDFSGFSDYQCEAIPAQGNRTDTVRWYWEAGHFKKELGDIILTRVLTSQESGPVASAEIFGMRLTAASLERNSKRIRMERTSCAARHPEIFSEVSTLTARTPPTAP